MAESKSGAAPQKAKGGRKGAPMPARRPEEMAPEAGFEGNLNYHVTRAIDALLGQNEAERGRQAQQYYEKYGYGG